LLPAELIQEDKLTIKNFVLALEQILILQINPEYNNLKVAGSSQGYIYPRDSKNRVWTPERQVQRLEHLNRLNSSSEHLEHLSRQRAIRAHLVSVLDCLNNTITTYSSISETAVAIGVSKSAIS